MKAILFFSLLALSLPTLAFEQKLPACSELSKLWTGSYYRKLNPNWGYGPLPCHKSESNLTKLDKVKILTARAAYILDKTIFNYRLPSVPIVSYGRIQAPPKSMLNWVSNQIKGLTYNASAEYAYASRATGRIILTSADYNVSGPMEFGIGLAGQIVHESRHLGRDQYGHVLCEVPGVEGYNCDPTISEEFEYGGSHAVAALWLAYVAKNSYWPQAERNKARDVVRWVLLNRINDSYEVRNAFSQRYLWEKL